MRPKSTVCSKWSCRSSETICSWTRSQSRPSCARNRCPSSRFLWPTSATTTKGRFNSFSLYGGVANAGSAGRFLEHAIGRFKDWSGDVLELGGSGKCYVKPQEGPFQFVSVQFFLEKSCYATMAIRELTHSSTDYQSQEALFAQIKLLGGEEASG